MFYLCNSDCEGRWGGNCAEHWDQDGLVAVLIYPRYTRVDPDPRKDLPEGFTGPFLALAEIWESPNGCEIKIVTRENILEKNLSGSCTVVIDSSSIRNRTYTRDVFESITPTMQQRNPDGCETVFHTLREAGTSGYSQFGTYVKSTTVDLATQTAHKE